MFEIKTTISANTLTLSLPLKKTFVILILDIVLLLRIVPWLIWATYNPFPMISGKVCRSYVAVTFKSYCLSSIPKLVFLEFQTHVASRRFSIIWKSFLCLIYWLRYWGGKIAGYCTTALIVIYSLFHFSFNIISEILNSYFVSKSFEAFASGVNSKYRENIFFFPTQKQYFESPE